MQRLLRKFRVRSLLIPGLALVAPAAGAQTTVRGHVTNETGTPITAVSVAIRSLNVGATTDATGSYTFTVPAARSTGQTVTMTVRRIGFTPKDVAVTLSGGTVTHDVSITATATELEGIIVTALGIEQEKSKLGTSVQQVSAEKLTQTPTISITDALQGKVAGLQITGSGTQGGSSKILIRGANSISGNNDPLFIIDGQPVTNADRGGSPGGSRADYGSAIADVNPDDVESISVLKGPNAAALYGSRASNGVVLITTKRGRSTGGRVSTEITTSQSWDTPSILPQYQNQYGQGAGGEFRYVDGKGGGVQDGNDQSYGPKLDGRTTGCTFLSGTHTYDAQPCMQFTGAGPWIAHPDNVYSFFNTGADEQRLRLAQRRHRQRRGAALGWRGEHQGLHPERDAAEVHHAAQRLARPQHPAHDDRVAVVRQELGHGPARRRLQPGHSRAVHLVRTPGRHERAARVLRQVREFVQLELQLSQQPVLSAVRQPAERLARSLHRDGIGHVQVQRLVGRHGAGWL